MINSDKTQLLGAIDIGTTKIVSVIGKRNEDGRFEILGMGTCPSLGIKRGLVMNIEETISSIRTAINNMSETTNLITDKVVVGIAAQHVKSLKNNFKINISSEGGEIKEVDVLRLKRKMFDTPVSSGESILHVIPQTYILDGKDFVPQPVGWIAKELEGRFHLVVGKRSSMENIKNCVRRVDKQVEKLVLEPLASADAVLSDREKEMGVALVDIGGGTTDIAVYRDKVLQHTAVIPFGGNSVTGDIKEAFSILESQAEDLKIQYGSALQLKNQEGVMIEVPGLKGRESRKISLNDLDYVIQERMSEIVYAVKFQLEASGYAEKLGAGVVLTGGGAKLKNLTQLVKFITKQDVIVSSPREYITGPFQEDVNQPKFSTAVGLLIRYDKMLKEEQHEAEIPDVLESENSVNEQIEEEEKAENSGKSERKKIGFFDKIKETVKKTFEENDDDNF